MKDVGLRIRIQKELREQFLAACKAQDKPAAQVLREFMREYVERSEARTSLKLSLLKHRSFHRVEACEPMNAVEIEEAISALANQPIEAEQFPSASLEAFGKPKRQRAAS